MLNIIVGRYLKKVGLIYFGNQNKKTFNLSISPKNMFIVIKYQKLIIE